MTKLWFKARSYGWGWTPVSWQGWAVTAAALILIGLGSAAFIARVRSGADIRAAVIGFLLWNFAVAGGLMVVAWITGEQPRWRWGE
jgi:hypothetical protein